ncbi:MAG: hypothetical protein J6Y94_06165, partial [Bacteriovoracaceae bacterium]|nr:hypothetical protein [Bacteriovoracaceae bacterium]
MASLFVRGGLVWLLSGFFSFTAQALCVLMQDFAPEAPEFEAHGRRHFYHKSITQAKVKVERKLMPAPTRLTVAGEACYIFKTYQQLRDFVIHRDAYPVSYKHPSLK